MRKSEDQITDADRKDADRRIKGGEAEESPDESGGDEQLAAGVSLPIRHGASTTMTAE